eukprot:scaffold21199_cov74-Phaeocystis_antarctica.AAC.1
MLAADTVTTTGGNRLKAFAAWRGGKQPPGRRALHGNSQRREDAIMHFTELPARSVVVTD